MPLEKCPKCGELALIKTPHGRVYKRRWGTDVYAYSVYSWDCLKCQHTSGKFNEK